METVLVVEDEPAVLRLISQLLQLNGYTVFEAANGPDALHLVKQCQHPIDVLLTDIVMPAMSGVELAKRLTQYYPGLRVLFTSGYMDHSAVKEVVGSGEQFLPKPFSPAELAMRVRGLAHPDGRNCPTKSRFAGRKTPYRAAGSETTGT
jgi:two-component system cell cycle sensor histidine kinase/response regulator CckA